MRVQILPTAFVGIRIIAVRHGEVIEIKPGTFKKRAHWACIFKEENTMKFNALRHLAGTTEVFTEEIFNTLMEYVDYNSTGMRVVVTEILTIFKERIEKGNDISFFKTAEVFNEKDFKLMILENFGEEICEDVFKIELD